MASRPSFTSSEPGRITFTVPPEWFVTISAVSRQPYQQNILIDSDLAIINHTNLGFGPGMMRDSNTSLLSSSISQFWDPTPTEFEVFCSNTTSTLRQTGAQMRGLANRAYSATVTEVPRPPNAPDDIPEYINYFVFVEDNDQSAGLYDMLLVLSIQTTNRNPIPPPPPDNIVRPYNPVLDLPWPETLENYLHRYQVHFLVDDSGSMTGEDRWTDASNALIGLSHAIYDRRLVSDGFGLSFLNNAARLQGITGRDTVTDIIRQVGTPVGGTPTGQRTSELLNAHIDVLDAAIGTPAYVEIKPFNLIVITDGAATDPAEYELGKMLVAVGDRLAAVPHHPNSLGVQFVQVGSDEAAKALLERLLTLNTGHIVDTVPWRGPGSLSPDRLERILLGGLQPNVRALRAARARLAAEAAAAKANNGGITPTEEEANSAA